MQNKQYTISTFTEKFNYPARYRAKLSTLHSDIISYSLSHYRGNRTFKDHIVHLINSATAHVIYGESWEIDLNKPDPTDNEVLDSEYLQELLGDYYVHDIVWDMRSAPVPTVADTPISAKKPKSNPKVDIQSATAVVETPKEDLYLRPPIIPRFDPTKPWLDMVKDGERYTIYTTLPIIPTVQNEISVTTDINKFTESDFMNLYPNRFIRTRKAIMYEPCGDLSFDSDLGVILPISGYTEDQVRKNIIEYPHFYKLIRFMNDKANSFYGQIEIDGELFDTMSVWDELPDSKFIPKSSEFIKEYVVRRWLLERDSGIEHKYPMYGTLEKFLTLFTTPEQYASWGYDPVELGKSLISARVSFLRSRNPIIRRCIGHG